MRLLPLSATSLAAALLLAALLLAACRPGTATPLPAVPAPGEPSAPPSAPGGTPSAADLDGRTFIVTRADGYAIVPASEITLRFERGQLGISAGCNQMGGAYQVVDGVLQVGAMMTTEMACEEPLMAQDAWIGGFVNGAVLALDGDTLTLVADGVTLTGTDRTVVRPDLPLEGTTRVVDGLIVNQAVSSVPAGVTATLVFTDGKVSAQSGCNSGSGPAEIGDTAITFGPIATTKIACGDPAMAVETHVLRVLAGDVAWSIEASSLTLLGAGGGLTAKAAS
jgi:heat shock protein HslJ